MAKTIIMPKLGLTMETGIVMKWLKKEGDEVRKGDPVLEVETDKIVNVIESPDSGVLLKVLVTIGS